MAGINPPDILLPAFLDPVLSYLSESLPSPLYSLLLELLSHSVALFTALFTLITSLLTTHPLEWDVHSFLPPIISVLASYVAIVGLYKTSSWMIRTCIWFIKWGTILGALFAGVGWYMGSVNANTVAASTVVSNIGNFVYDAVNGQGHNAAAGTRYRSHAQHTSTRSDKKKPKPWDSFEHHRGWQNEAHKADAGGSRNAEKVFQDITGKVGKAVMENGWWETAKRIVDGSLGEDTDSKRAGDTEGNHRKAETRAGRSRSR